MGLPPGDFTLTPGQAVTVTIKLFASFQKGRFAVEMRDYPSSTTVAEIARNLKIPVAEIGVVLVNARHVDLDFCPAPGDVLAIFPVIGGG
jgi:molybdopterin synthase sulfur carrier subunit